MLCETLEKVAAKKGGRKGYVRRGPGAVKEGPAGVWAKGGVGDRYTINTWSNEIPT